VKCSANDRFLDLKDSGYLRGIKNKDFLISDIKAIISL
jgi:hypothetical protein